MPEFDITGKSLDKAEPPNKELFQYLVPTQIKGYNLRTKKWHDLNMDRVYPNTWNKKAFDTLVLDFETKELVEALVSKQIASQKSTDLIAGKGNGLIMLLHGGPGTGKTLTAESVAEIAGKPLYRVTCGDVGTKAEDVEKYLDSVLHLGKIWNCVVLLDEAEVFLEQRTLDNLQRNALVSVFLRVLEYHEGILILTSNRVGTFDEAFRSRIQIAIHYPALGAFQRLQIWNNFIDRLDSFKDDTVDIRDLRGHLEDLQKVEMNGRQIRNVITTARQYAEWKGEKMNYAYLKIVMEVASKFDAYSTRLKGGFTDDQLAQDEGVR
ncbi:P-loop containing nucleoside triphosphate hydrolase protein [Massariosphaeria phaeospora]|uniref:P-loop containing nucleoside triphosphate hydrolase protein n=1 Tax=Massariosphaeria phaeospora TaxID=100035 RepID=A0A7C8M2T8_9PLEO|nr:P-loop containing nucleoside triphosphate hydrolase protein [Massariosphaeria phaeospora]